MDKQSSITLVELPSTQYGILNGDLSFDEYSRSKMPSRSLHILEGVLKKQGFENTESINPFYHGKKGKLTSENFKRIFDSDILLVSSITRTALQSMELSKMYDLNKNNPKGISVAGGFDATFRAEDWLNCVDYVVRGEGEMSISKLLEKVSDGQEGERVIEADNLLTSNELSEMSHPFYDNETKNNIITVPIETSRGCPNDCDFCSVTEFYGNKYRTKSIDYVIRELHRTKNIGKFNFFIDDNFIIPSQKGVKRTNDLLEGIINDDLNKKTGLAQVTVDLAKKPKTMGLMKKAGIKYLFVGVESISDNSLKELGKPYLAEQNKEAIETFRENGFWTHAMMISSPGEDYDSYRENLSWVKENADSMQLFPLVPIPGTRIYKKMEDENGIISKDWSLYDGHHVLIKPKNLTPYEHQKLIFDAYRDFYSVKNSLKRLKNSPNKKITLGLMTYTNIFRGIKKVIGSPQSKDYLEFLKGIS